MLNYTIVTGTASKDYNRDEKYYLRALKIDNKYGKAHNNYAALLEYKLHNNNLAEYHYKQWLKCDPDVPGRNYNFAVF